MIGSQNSFDLGVKWHFPEAKRYTFVFLSLLIALVLIYSNSFDCSFHFDDTPNILENPNVQPESLSWGELEKSLYGIDLNHEKIKRPLSYLSLAINYYFSGENVFSYHVVNFFIHLITSVFLFLLIYNTLKLPLLKDRYGKSAYAIALLAVFFWAAHPIQLTAVTYIVQRMAAMAGMFYVMSMYFYLKARTTGRPAGRGVYFFLCAAAALAAFASKENAAMLPIVLFLYELFLIRGISRESLKKALCFSVVPVLVFVLLAVFYVDLSSFLSGYENRPFTLAERIMTQPRILMLYLSLLVYPVSSRLMLIHDVPLSQSLIDPWTTGASIVFILAALSAALYYSRKWPLIAFCVIFFFINHVIESSIIPLELVYEHRNYIPSMFFFVLIAIIMVRVLDYFSYRPSIQFLMAFGFCFLLSAQAHTTYDRNKVWENEILLWSDNAQKAPRLSRVHTNLGKAYADVGISDEAADCFQKALELSTIMRKDDLATLLYNAALASHHQGDDKAALKYFESSLEVSPGREKNLALLCQLHLKNQRIERAYAELKGRIKNLDDLKNPELMKTYSTVMYHLGRKEQARDMAVKVLRQNPGHPDVLVLMACLSEDEGKTDKAEWFWRRYLEKRPESLKARLGLIELYARTGDSSKLGDMAEELYCLSRGEDLCSLMENLEKGRDMNIVYQPDFEVLRAVSRKALQNKAARFMDCDTGSISGVRVEGGQQ